ncbi:hypothetical protein [Streptococcus pneumoniae]|uniref:hypothetical protein n=1 Tax=Streptococcus pneumoniae TaxID=1313 RepID=UPI00177AC95C|nr:hypothetical protein [Streptococcus pneumoniae]
MVNVKEYPLYFFSYSMEIKEQTRKLGADSSKHCFEVVDETTTSQLGFEVVVETTTSQ